MTGTKTSLLAPTDHFVDRHVGLGAQGIEAMLQTLGVDNLEGLIAQAVPAQIRTSKPLEVGPGCTEHEMLARAAELASQNKVFRSFLGMGYHNCLTPPVILRNILENPGWYTQYTPYQAEISQGRLEALLNFQTLVTDLTGLQLSNASLLDEGTAAAEAMAVCYASGRKRKGNVFFVADDCHPQTIDVIKTRAEPIGVEVVVGDWSTYAWSKDVFGALLQYPNTHGHAVDYEALVETIHSHEALVVVATDLLALTMLRPPGDFGADFAVGNTQRFGVPLGYGGPHAAFFAAGEKYRRLIPGRIVGVSKDTQGRQALRLALQTREQHIRRERATSNICTSQVLLAIVAAMYATYHGPDGLLAIARRVKALTSVLAQGLQKLGFDIGGADFFDTLTVQVGQNEAQIMERALAARVNLRGYGDGRIGVSMDEAAGPGDIRSLWAIFAGAEADFAPEDLVETAKVDFEGPLARTSEYLTHPVWHEHRSETELLRYIHRLQSRDLSLTTSMIPLGSCTMKLNATAEMIPVTWAGFGNLHPFAPRDQAQGYKVLFDELEASLADITGFAGVSLQPNAGSQGEYTGLLVIRAYHHARGDAHRTICLIPSSAHGTNPASAVMAGMKVVVVKCDDEGNIDIEDLKAKAEKHAENLAALMVTYPSTHGVFEEEIKTICEVVHGHGGQVYLDGANLNALVGLCRPGELGADVCHLNLHKTFCLSEGTPVTLDSGVTLPIEQLRVGRKVKAWSESDQGVLSASLEGAYKTGRKDCVEVTLEDGRSFVCTDDHRVLTTEGWIEAGQLDLEGHRLVVGPDAAADDLLVDQAAEREFEAFYGTLHLTMGTPLARARTLAFFRILGALLSDGTYSQEKVSGRLHCRLFAGTRYDAESLIDDIEALTGKRPTISTCNEVFSVRLPQELMLALTDVPGMGEPGPRVETKATLPSVITAETTPLAVLREFFGGLFGGDGCAPVVVHLDAAPDTMGPVRFVQTRLCQDTLERLMTEIAQGLARLGVEALVAKSLDVGGGRWRGTLRVAEGTAFAERVGFRHCAHKSARLAAATAWWRLKETVQRQRIEVANRALTAVAVAGGGVRGPKPVWGPAVESAFEALEAEQPVLNAYYAGFQGNERVSQQHLRLAVEGAIGKRKGIQGVRRTRRRQVFPAFNKKGQSTGMPTLKDFLAGIGALDWFQAENSRGNGYKVSYATSSKQDVVEPTMSLGVVDVRPVGKRVVYDLTVTTHHSFLANGVVVHNCIPHGGGGPGLGPIGVAPQLVPFLPTHGQLKVGGDQAIGPVSAAPWGSPSILPISWGYIEMMGSEGLTHATKVAILNANYIATRLEPHYPILYTGKEGRVAHECIIDVRHFKRDAGISVADIAKRLMDYGFHAPTMSWPVAGTLMIEPTESESKPELDRFCDAMIAIRQEIQAVIDGRWPQDNNPLVHAPHTADEISADAWDHPYSRQEAAFPVKWLRGAKFWPSVSRVDDAYGDRNLVCSCPPIESFEEEG